jgi:hypothetical protein
VVGVTVKKNDRRKKDLSGNRPVVVKTIATGADRQTGGVEPCEE